MMNNLDELENLARGAAEVWDGNSEYHFRMSDCGPIVAERMGQFCDKANPETVLKLIAVARAVGKLIDNSAIVGNSGEFEWSSPVEEYDAVCLALDALEVADPR